MVKYIIVRHRVRDYAQWKKVFDATLEDCFKAGLRGGDVCRDANDPQMITVAMKCTDLKAASEFIESPRIKEAMEQGGVIDQPQVLLLEQLAEVPEPVEVSGQIGP